MDGMRSRKRRMEGRHKVDTNQGVCFITILFWTLEGQGSASSDATPIDVLTIHLYRCTVVPSSLSPPLTPHNIMMPLDSGHPLGHLMFTDLNRRSDGDHIGNWVLN